MPGIGSDEGPTPEEIATQKVIEDRKVEAMTKLRSERDALIHPTDKYVMLDYPINDKLRDKLKWYRQHLRDLPGMSSPDLDEDGNLTGVEWPTFEGIEVKMTPPLAQEKDLEATKTELKADLSETKADLSETKTNLQTTQTDLQTTRTELAEERTLHETTRTQVRNTQTELDVAKIKLLNIEARMHEPPVLPQVIGFHAYTSTRTTLSGNSSITNHFDLTYYNYNSCYNTSTGIFTAPFGGLYGVELQLRSLSTYYCVFIELRDASGSLRRYVINQCERDVTTNNEHRNMAGFTWMEAGDTLKIRTSSGSGSMYVDTGSWSQYVVVLIHKTL